MGDAIKKDAQVHIRLSSADRENLLRLSILLGLSPSELIRKSIPAYAAQLLNRRRRRNAKGEPQPTG